MIRVQGFHFCAWFRNFGRKMRGSMGFFAMLEREGGEVGLQEREEAKRNEIKGFRV